LDGNDEENIDIDGESSFHLGKTKVGRANMWASVRMTPSFDEFGPQFDLVPTLLVDNVTLVTDPTLQNNERGRLYMAENSFNHKLEQPMYAYTVNETIYQRILSEIHDSVAVPCGLYFCCHGGDGAHTGISPDDYVDIRLAWALVGGIFAVMTLLSL
jgi:hypothetical protein